ERPVGSGKRLFVSPQGRECVAASKPGFSKLGIDLQRAAIRSERIIVRLGLAKNISQIDPYLRISGIRCGSQSEAFNCTVVAAQFRQCQPAIVQGSAAEGSDLKKTIENFQCFGRTFQEKKNGRPEIERDRVSSVDCERLVEAEQRVFGPARFGQNFSFVDMEIRVVRI